MLRKLFVGDKVLWGIIIFLFLVSILVAYSATVTKSGDFYLLNALKQAGYAFGGLFAAWLISWAVSPSWVIDKARFLVVFAIGVSVLVFVPEVGAERNEAMRWIHVPFSEKTVSPFDFLRLFLMIDLVAQLSKRADVIGRIMIFPDFWRIDAKSWQTTKAIFKKVTWPIFWPTIVGIGIIAYGNFSTAVILFLMVLLILWFGNVHKREIAKIFFAALLVGSLLVCGMYLAGVGRGITIVHRLSDIFLPSARTEQVLPQDSTAGKTKKITEAELYGFYTSDSKAQGYDALPDSDFQKEMSKGAIASGGLKGKGPGNSTFRAKLPHAANDCVFAFIVEEYGLIGSLFIVLVYVMILVRGGTIARRSKYYCFYILSMAIVLHIFITAVVNMMVSVGFFVTGQTLPLISKGGISILANSMALGILLGISACPTRQVPQTVNIPEEALQ